ncbi:hypothetical protein [Streptomyces hydrogenans]|uniref:hypothetical protein n=1 Tax=Streptomyces hydrogenans TaxID=1873719 RepID=UPI0035DA49EC
MAEGDGAGGGAMGGPSTGTQSKTGSGTGGTTPGGFDPSQFFGQMAPQDSTAPITIYQLQPGPRPLSPMYKAKQTTFGQYVQGLTSDEFKKLQQQMFTAGLYDSKQKDLSDRIRWGDKGDVYTVSALSMLQKVMQESANNGLVLSIDDALRQLADNPSIMGAGGGRAPNAPKPRATTTDTRTEAKETSQQDAFQVMMQTMRELLGRNPTSSEAAAFTRGLNALERANPLVTTSTTTTDWKPVVDSTGRITSWEAASQDTQTSQSGGGINPQAEAMMNVMSNFGAEGAGYSIMQYRDAFEQALSGGIQLG